MTVAEHEERGSQVMGTHEAEEHTKERRLMAQMTTTPSSNGEAALPRRTPRGLLPSTWAGRSVRVEYMDGSGEAASTTGALLEYFPFGPVLKSVEGDKFALSWERISLIEVVED